MNKKLDIMLRIVVGILLVITLITLITTGFSNIFKILVAVMLILALGYQFLKRQG